MIMINVGSSKTPIEWDIEDNPHLMLIAKNPKLGEALTQNMIRTIEEYNVVVFEESMLDNQEEVITELASDEEPIDTILVVSHPDMSDDRVEEFFENVYEVGEGLHVVAIMPDIIDVFTRNSHARILL